MPNPAQSIAIKRTVLITDLIPLSHKYCKKEQINYADQAVNPDIVNTITVRPVILINTHKSLPGTQAQNSHYQSNKRTHNQKFPDLVDEQTVWIENYSQEGYFNRDRRRFCRRGRITEKYVKFPSPKKCRKRRVSDSKHRQIKRNCRQVQYGCPNYHYLV